MKIFLIVMLLNLAGAGFANTPTTSLARGLAGTDKSTVFLPMLARGLVNLDMAIFSQAQAVLGMLTTEELEASFDSYPIRSALGMKLVTMISEADLEADNELTQLMDRLVFQANILGLSNDITTNDKKMQQKVG